MFALATASASRDLRGLRSAALDQLTPAQLTTAAAERDYLLAEALLLRLVTVLHSPDDTLRRHHLDGIHLLLRQSPRRPHPWYETPAAASP